MAKALVLEPGTQEFDRRAREGNLVPVSCEVVADLETPISAYLRLRDLPRPFLLESVEGGSKVARYSFLGAQPRLTLRASSAGVEVIEGGAARRVSGDPLAAARAVLQRYRPVVDPTLPRFSGGLIGYFGYDLIRSIEHLPNQPPDDRRLPILSLDLADTVMIFDHLRHRIRVVANADVEEGAERAYRGARERIEQWLERLRRPVPEPRPTAEAPALR
ncbi:MAG TPA: anthranilate synthase component I, partial [bacterium]